MASAEGSRQQPAAHVAAAWRRSGFMKGPGIPPPSGLYEVGCVDVMLACKPEDTAASNPADPDTVLMRLFYPTNTTGRASTDDYAKWFPHPKYVGAYADCQGWKVSALWSTMMKSLTTPRTPALLAAALIGGPTKAEAKESKPATGESKPDKPSSDVDKGDETPNGDHAPTGSGESEETGAKETEQTNSEPAEAETESTSSLPDPFPVIIFSHEARHMRTAYSAICCDLASHGYLVACIEHRDQSACLSFRKVLVETAQEGLQQRYQEEWINYQASKNTTEQLPFRVKEVEKALDLLKALNEGKEMVNLLGEGQFDLLQFKNRLRVDAIAAIGHSMGGATVVQSLFKDKRIKCGIGLDALLSPTVPDEVFLEGVEQPLLFVNSFSFLTVETIQLMKKLEKDPDETTTFSPCQILTIKGTVSQSLSDVFFALPDLFVTGSQPPVNPQTIHSLVVGLCRAFLKRFLLKDLADQGQAVPNLDGGEGASEHILFGTNVQEPETATATPKTSDQPGLENPVENGPTVTAEASPTAANLEEESEDKRQQQQQEQGGELKKAEQHSETQEGSGEGAEERETHPESLEPETTTATQKTSDQPGLESPVENEATVVAEASPTAANLEEESEDKQQQQQQQEQESGEPEKVEQHSEAQRGSDEGAGEKETHPELLHDEQPKEEAQLIDQSADEHVSKLTEQETPVVDEAQALEDKPQPDEDQHQPDEGKPQPDEHQPQPDEHQPQPDEHQPQPDEGQPQPDEGQPQIDDDQPHPEEGDDDKEKSTKKDEQPHDSKVEEQPLQQNEESPSQDAEETHGSGTEKQHSEEHIEKSEA